MAVVPRQLDPSFFWPYAESVPPPEPFWCSLTDLKVKFDLGSPSRRWYFRGEPGDPYNVPGSDEPLPADTIDLMPPGYGSEEDTEAALEYDRLMRSKEVRIVSDDDLLIPFTRVVAHLPVLQSACLTTDLRRPCMVCGYNDYLKDPDESASEPRVFFRVYDWTPPKQVLDLSREAAREKFQQEAVITFLPSLSTLDMSRFKY
ncbi:hypothetical protein C7999DRAFT_43937 [Corynascus novoguineensis]|uniref:Uncharacterized protein n=1 Tax=Corynascus novoguineensis TaxID=1126955 RepID=A0AAN7CLS7_9PEZI|nr:hypothetical protein C7999DRAFT_43937 [Corynascus novoguineensis]